MKVTPSKLPEVLILEPKVFGDHRGFFLETYRQEAFSDLGINLPFVQDNHSRSSRGTLRGLHYQLEQPQGKLVRVALGSVFDVAVDVRVGSPNFGKWFGTILDDKDMKMLYVPPGFAHGFLVLTDVADFIYKCTDYYHPESEQGILWNDPDIGVEWPGNEILLSNKDSESILLKNQSVEKLPFYSELQL